MGGVAVQNLNEDTLGSHLKAGIAQFVALEFTRAAGRDNRILNRYLPWLYHPPSAMQQGLAVVLYNRPLSRIFLTFGRLTDLFVFFWRISLNSAEPHLLLLKRNISSHH